MVRWPELRVNDRFVGAHDPDEKAPGQWWPGASHDGACLVRNYLSKKYADSWEPSIVVMITL